MPQAAAALAIEPPGFLAGQLIQADGSDLRVVNYSVPEVADWNADGMPDLGRRDEYVSVEVAQHPLRPGLGTVDRNDSEPLGPCLLHPRLNDPIGLPKSG